MDEEIGEELMNFTRNLSPDLEFLIVLYEKLAWKWNYYESVLIFYVFS